MLHYCCYTKTGSCLTVIVVFVAECEDLVSRLGAQNSTNPEKIADQYSSHLKTLLVGAKKNAGWLGTWEDAHLEQGSLVLRLPPLKGQSHEIFWTRFFHQLAHSGPIRDVLWPVQFFCLFIELLDF